MTLGDGFGWCLVTGESGGSGGAKTLRVPEHCTGKKTTIQRWRYNNASTVDYNLNNNNILLKLQNTPFSIT